MQKLKELKNLARPELLKLLSKTREELRAARFRLRSGQEKDVRSIREMRQTVARILTLLSAAKDGGKEA